MKKEKHHRFIRMIKGEKDFLIQTFENCLYLKHTVLNVTRT
jgi:hypothetical protein